MKKYKLYLDNWIIYPFFNTKDKRHEKVKEFMKVASESMDITLCISDFSFTEFTKVARSEESLPPAKVNEIVSKIMRTGKVGKFPIEILDYEGDEQNYKLADFFVHIQEILINTRPTPSIADAIHASIMHNNKVGLIVTGDSHFDNVEDIEKLTIEKAMNFFENLGKLRKEMVRSKDLIKRSKRFLNSYPA